MNTQHSDREETSSSSSVGVSIAMGGDKSGFRVTGSGSFSKERENANGSAWTESTVNAGNQLTITTGKDANFIGGQLKGEQVTANIGGDLNIQSLQDTDDFDYKKLSGAIDGSIGSGGSLNVSLSQTTMDSHWASVTDQSGIFAGKDGFDITVGNNTDLKGGVISSTAKDKTQNSLDTGTISFEDIQNKADYQVDHNSISVGTSGGAPMANYHKKDKDSSTTHSAVEEGTLIVRNQDEQQQNLDDLSRDTDNANNELGKIFDKQKHQDTIDTLQLINDIGKQVNDVLANVDKMAAQKEAQAKVNDPEYLAQIEKEVLAKNPNAKPQDITQAAYEKAYNNAMSQSGTALGGDMKQGVDSAISIITGLVSGNIAGGLAGAAAPHIAEELKALEQTNPEAHKIAHGILGGLVAQLQGNSALAGATGAAAGEIAAGIIKDALYGKDTKTEDLSPEQKDKISGLASLVGGLAGALTGDSSTVADAVTGTSAGKNAVENNSLAGDKAREVIKEGTEGWKEIIRNTVGKNVISQIANGALTIAGDGLDLATGGADYVLDSVLALGSCTMGADYCKTAINDIQGKNEAVADQVKALVSGEAWEGFKHVFKKALEGDQLALEQVSSMILAMGIPAKKIPNAGKGAGKIDGIVEGSVGKETGIDANKVKDNVATSQKGNGSSNFGEHLSKEQLVQQSVVLKQDVMDFRAGLPSGIKKSGNAASADVNIEGISSNKLLAHSRVENAIPEKGIVGKGNGIFQTEILPSADGRFINRATDSEAKIFEHLASQLGSNTSAKGTVTIMTERPACASCLGVADQFRAKYPNIKVNIVDNGGNVLKPTRKQ